MPTVLETINIAKVSMFLASQDIAKAAFKGGFPDAKLANKLYMERKAVEWKYTYDSGNVTDLTKTKNYLFDLCWRAAAAALIVNEGGGGTVIGGEGAEIGGDGGAFEGDLFS
jgi:hypothetical protein